MFHKILLVFGLAIGAWTLTGVSTAAAQDCAHRGMMCNAATPCCVAGDRCMGTCEPRCVPSGQMCDFDSLCCNINDFCDNGICQPVANNSNPGGTNTISKLLGIR